LIRHSWRRRRAPAARVTARQSAFTGTLHAFQRIVQKRCAIACFHCVPLLFEGVAW
jgi:hypothetical protein